MLTPELVEHLLAPVSIMVATADARLRPGLVRAFGISGEAGGDRVTLYTPVVTAGAMLAHLEQRKTVAVQVGNWANFRGVQLKGEVVDVRPAGPEADAVIDHTTRSVIEITSRIVGQAFADSWARHVTRPAIAVTFLVREVYDQTPGPRAGTRIG